MLPTPIYITDPADRLIDMLADFAAMMVIEEVEKTETVNPDNYDTRNPNPDNLRHR